MILPPKLPPEREQYDVPFILDHMGVDFSRFEGKILDIGCGIEARLVEHLRNFGIPAEGIDPVLEIKRSYLIQAFDYEPIQRPDNHYDLAFSHMASFRNGTYTFKGFGEKMTTVSKKTKDLAQMVVDKAMLESIKQTMRVLKPGKELRIFPRPRYWLDTYPEELEKLGIEVRTERVLDQATERLDRVYLVFNMEFGSPTKELFEEEFYHRAVLIMPS